MLRVADEGALCHVRRRSRGRRLPHAHVVVGYTQFKPGFLFFEGKEIMKWVPMDAKGIIIKGVDSSNKESLSFLEQNISKGDLNKFKKNTVFIGAELAFNLDLKIGDKINLMSSAFVATPFGGLPKQEIFTSAALAAALALSLAPLPLSLPSPDSPASPSSLSSLASYSVSST